ncbi:CBM9 family sugar-binding protein [Thalassotalea sp. LPB0316]|uniref:sugar-binding protein n=1 Tax=Thalassotalea sp. LPB0316 TaxID=2769490 RepID=UPI0018692DA0|nr:sugar-binding protein [Thalassotalea sp. LPB0316]QOL24596.1 CBM9 family sugar-binding protein [Thalassotalea sp. LPB0316]
MKYPKSLLPLYLTLSVSGSMSLTVMAQDVPYSQTPINIDGQLTENAWQQATWHKLEHHIVGTVPTPEDFSGQYKLLWDEQYLYLAAKITDDILFDQFANPLERYWDDDCLEVFLDEDNSGGEHQFNFNAFAYHIALDNQAVDIGSEKNGEAEFILLNEHVNSVWQRQSEAPHEVIWEVAIEIHNDKFLPNTNTDSRVTLSENKTLGFMLAYCDNDGSSEREHFMGSHAIKPINGDKNLGYKTADVFGRLKLVK